MSLAPRQCASKAKPSRETIGLTNENRAILAGGVVVTTRLQQHCGQFRADNTRINCGSLPLCGDRMHETQEKKKQAANPAQHYSAVFRCLMDSSWR
jgi:hypothetical protein